MTTALRDERRAEELRSFAVLDTPAEAGFDDLTELAAHLCQAPIALVSLVEADRQWFKSAVGLDVPGTAIEDSFCRYALDEANLSDAGLLEVPDATADERFAANPLVTGPERVRFYAGAPLTTASGNTLGTLCVLDTRPRELTAGQQRHLLLLARQVLAQLEMRRHAREASVRSLEQARARAELERNQRLLDGVLAASQAVIYAKDTDGRFLLANPALHQLLGRPDGSLPGMSNWDVFPPLAADQFHRNDRDVAASGAASSFTELLTHPDGQVHEYLTTKFPLHTDDGAVYAVGGVSTDVTALAQHRQQLADSLNRWRALVERSPVPVAVIAADGTFAYANPPAQALYEQAIIGDVTGRSAADYCPPGAEQATRELFHQVLQGTSVVGQPWRLQRPDGTLIDVEINAVAIEYDGAPAVQVELRDITARAAADAALRASEARWRAVFDASPVGIGLADEHGRFIAANAALCTLLGRADGDIIGHSSAEFTHPDDLDSHRTTSTLIADSPHGYVRIEKRYLRPDGTARWAWLTVTHTPGPDGQTWTLAHVQDVTDRIAVEQAVRDSEANLTAVAAVVHDIQSGADARHSIVHAGLAMAEAAVVCLLEPSADRAELSVTASTLQSLTGISVPVMGGSATADVYASGHPLFVADVAAHPGGSPALTQLPDARSLYLVPVRTGTDTHAVLLIAWSSVIDTLEDRRVAGATLLSDQAGVALRQASLLNELSDLALTDSLTGLPNRRSWDQRLDRLLTRARRTGHPLTVALADLDHFKRFNDTYGHLDGDALLTDFAAAAARKLRDDDTLARWGGEEFAIALPDCATEDAPTVLNKLRAVVPRAQTVSIGFATFDGTETAAELTARADRALYFAKEHGRDQVRALPDVPAAADEPNADTTGS